MKEKHSFHLILTVFVVATGLLQMRPLLAQGVAPKPAILVAQAQDNLISKEAMASNAAAATKGLSLSQVLDAVAATYPILVAARTEAKAAGQDLQATERLRWPTVSAVVESDTGNLRSSPNRAVQVEQTVWDAGRNSSRISESKVLAGHLAKERAAAAVSDSSAKVAALRITLARLNAEVYNKVLKFDSSLLAYTDYIRNQTDLYNKRQTAFKDDVSALESILKLAEDELRINSQLEISGDVSRAEILRLQRSVADIKSQLTNRRNKYFQDVQAEMTKAQEDLSTQTEQLNDRRQVLEHTELIAPMDAVVNNIRINTLGGVVRSGEVVMELMPAGDNLVVEAKVSPADIAFVEVGQLTTIKLDAYDSSIHGSMRGEVSYISPDVLIEETKQGPVSHFRVRVKVTGKEFKGAKADDIRLRAGLTATVEIKALDRTVLSYLTKPITKTLSQSMGER